MLKYQVTHQASQNKSLHYSIHSQTVSLDIPLTHQHIGEFLEPMTIRPYLDDIKMEGQNQFQNQ